MVQPHLQLTNSALSQIVHSAWLAETKNPELPDRETLSRLLFLGHEVPPSIRSIRRTADQLTALLFEAQEVKLIERVNPSSQTARLKLDLIQALNLLDQLRLEFPDEVDWARSRIREFAGQPAM